MGTEETIECPNCEVTIGKTETACPKCGIVIEEFEDTITAVEKANAALERRKKKNAPPDSPAPEPARRSPLLSLGRAIRKGGK